MIAGGKVAYVGVVGRWVDMIVRVYRSPIDCSSFLTNRKQGFQLRERMREEVLEVRRESRK